MGYWAQLGKKNNVIRVIVADEEFIKSGSVVGRFVETHKSRKDFASRGDTYDTERKTFIPPQPYKSWTYNHRAQEWKAPKASPVQRPEEGQYFDWDERLQDWVERIEAV
jgi:hypothetical protein